MTDPPDGRLTRAESDIKELLKEVGAYRAEVLQWRLDLSKDYIARPEAESREKFYEERLRRFEDRLDRNEERGNQVADQAGGRGWQIAGSLTVAILSAIFSAIGWFRPH